MHGLAIRVARAVNRKLGRAGAVWSDRYHARALGTPTEVWRALRYVLHNWRKHAHGSRGLDRCASGAWFRGWARSMGRLLGPPPVAAPRTWLLAVGWTRCGPLDVVGAPRQRDAGRSHPPTSAVSRSASAGPQLPGS
jgi:hypothetical protein